MAGRRTAQVSYRVPRQVCVVGCSGRQDSYSRAASGAGLHHAVRAVRLAPGHTAHWLGGPDKTSFAEFGILLAATGIAEHDRDGSHQGRR